MEIENESESVQRQHVVMRLIIYCYCAMKLNERVHGSVRCRYHHFDPVSNDFIVHILFCRSVIRLIKSRWPAAL